MSVGGEFAIRVGTRDDADAITDVQVASWRAGYAHVFPDSLLYADDFDSTRRSFWRNWRFEAGHRIAVVVDPGTVDAGADDESEGRVIGFCSYGPERERARGHTGRGEIWAFYLHPDFWGSGAAAPLMDFVEQRLRAEGFGTAVLWVLDDNPRARRFYERHGWSASGIDALFDDYCDVSVPEVEYRKELA